MGKRRAYRATAVKKVVLEKLLELAPVGDVHLGMDIGKGEVFTVIRWSDGTFESPWKAKNPTEIGELVALLQVLAKDRAVTVAMESTGTYGDALRQALSDAGLSVHRVSGKAAHDCAEIFDGESTKPRRTSCPLSIGCWQPSEKPNRRQPKVQSESLTPCLTPC